MPCRESPFTKTNNSGGGFGEQRLSTDCEGITQVTYCNPIVLCYAVGDMDLLFMRTTRYESEASSGTCSVLLLWSVLLGKALWSSAYLHKCTIQNDTESSAVTSCWHALSAGKAMDTLTQWSGCLLQALAAGMGCKWQMAHACPYPFGPSGLALGGKSTTTQKRCSLLWQSLSY
jgi:hypothetical protein